jgi:hypothetical protein
VRAHSKLLPNTAPYPTLLGKHVCLCDRHDVDLVCARCNISVTSQITGERTDDRRRSRCTGQKFPVTFCFCYVEFQDLKSRIFDFRNFTFKRILRSLKLARMKISDRLSIKPVVIFPNLRYRPKLLTNISSNKVQR